MLQNQGLAVSKKVGFSDKQLYRLCQKYGARALVAREKFLRLLPEVARRELWRRRGYQSIYHFAATLAGVSQAHVNRILSLDKRYEDVPILAEALKSGEVTISKLARVASIANEKNAVELVKVCKKLSKSALECWVKEQRDLQIKTRLIDGMNSDQIESENGLFDAQSVIDFVPGHKQNVTQFYFEQDVQVELEELQLQGHDLNMVLRELLEKRRQELAKTEQEIEKEVEGKEELRREYLQRVIADEDVLETEQKRSRYISVEVRNILKRKFADLCSVQGCKKKADEIHHVREFSKGGWHTPGNLRPLCIGHHQLKHLKEFL